MSGRPLDVLEAAVGDEVEVRLKSGETYRGTLAGYDQHMNLVLDNAHGVEPWLEASVESSGGGEDQSEEPDATSDESADSAADASVDVRDTTIIRGDNVVSITP